MTYSGKHHIDSITGVLMSTCGKKCLHNTTCACSCHNRNEKSVCCSYFWQLPDFLQNQIRWCNNDLRILQTAMCHTQKMLAQGMQLLWLSRGLRLMGTFAKTCNRCGVTFPTSIANRTLCNGCIDQDVRSNQQPKKPTQIEDFTS